MAEGGGLEPPFPDPESGVLPLDDPSIFYIVNINILQHISYRSNNYS